MDIFGGRAGKKLLSVSVWAYFTVSIAHGVVPSQTPFSNSAISTQTNMVHPTYRVAVAIVADMHCTLNAYEIRILNLFGDGSGQRMKRER